jgi:hypothetical protein
MSLVKVYTPGVSVSPLRSPLPWLESTLLDLEAASVYAISMSLTAVVIEVGDGFL